MTESVSTSTHKPEPSNRNLLSSILSMIIFMAFGAIIGGFAFCYFLSPSASGINNQVKYFELNDMTSVDLAATDAILSGVDNKLEKFKIKSVSIDSRTSLVTLSTENLGFFEKHFLCDSRVICMDKKDGDWTASYSSEITPNPQAISVLINTAIEQSSQFQINVKHPTAFVNQYDENRISYADWMLKLEAIIRRNNPGAVNIDMWQEWSNWQEIYHLGNTPYAAYGVSLNAANQRNRAAPPATN